MKKLLKEFKEFAMKGNVLDLAVAVVLGAAFGKVVEGMDTVNEIAECDTDYSDRPLDPQVIAKMTVETFGVDYPAPEKA